MKVLVIEDDSKVAKFLVRAFSEEGYAVDHCAKGNDGVAQARMGVYDAIVLDWMLPDTDGLTVCRAIRAAGCVAPVMMITARGEIPERVMGLDAGADDYLVKPFHINELLARVRALVRRTSGFARIRVGEIEVDRVGRKAFVRGEAIDLTGREFGLLVHLAQNADQPVARTELLSQLWNTNFDPGSNLVEVHVSNLREKLGALAWMIETIRGVGYRLRSAREP